MKWKVTFEVDLGEHIPEESDLKPHDYPLKCWASQTIHDMILNHAVCAAHASACKYAAKGDDLMLSAIQEQARICIQARDSMQIERIE